MGAFRAPPPLASASSRDGEAIDPARRVVGTIALKRLAAPSSGRSRWGKGTIRPG
jgi:hypothetical protein